jgi:hypothetical protein
MTKKNQLAPFITSQWIKISIHSPRRRARRRDSRQQQQQIVNYKARGASARSRARARLNALRGNSLRLFHHHRFFTHFYFAHFDVFELFFASTKRAIKIPFMGDFFLLLLLRDEFIDEMKMRSSFVDVMIFFGLMKLGFFCWKYFKNDFEKYLKKKWFKILKEIMIKKYWKKLIKIYKKIQKDKFE